MFITMLPFPHVHAGLTTGLSLLTLTSLLLLVHPALGLGPILEYHLTLLAGPSLLVLSLRRLVYPK